MEVLCDLSRLKSGGGLQVGLGFLDSLESSNLSWRVLVSDQIACSLGVQSVDHVAVDTPKPHEALYSSDRSSVHYQLFGPGRFSPKGIPTVTGCAYSNLFYPEIDFWESAGRFAKRRARIQDVFRSSMLKMQDFIVFETDVLRARAISLWGLDPDRSFVLRPSISVAFSERLKVTSPNQFFKPDGRITLGAISGPHPNKRLDRVLDTLAALERCHPGVFRLVCTMDAKSPQVSAFADEVRARQLSDSVELVGQVPQTLVADLYRHLDGVVLFSRLESFSNNVIECLASRTPLIVTDYDWSRSQAGEAAIYVEPTAPEDAAALIAEVLMSESARSELSDCASLQLNKFPSPQDRHRALENILTTAATNASS